MKTSFLTSICCALFAFCACSSTSSIDNSTVASLDLQKFLGTWYELARYDHGFERGMTQCTAHYSIKSDGSIKVINKGLKKGKWSESEGKAKITATPGLLRVSFFGPFYSDYRIMMLAPDYSYALIGSGNAKYLWILSRTPQLPSETIQSILNESNRRGYDNSKLLWVTQGTTVNAMENANQ